MNTPDVSGACRTLPDMAKSDSERGPFGTWLVKQRKARPGEGRDGRMTAAEVRAWLIRDRGFGIGESAYAELESGTALPSPEQRRHLAALFDSEPPTGASGQSADLASLVAALDRQTVALTALVERLDRREQEGPEWAEAIARAVLAAVQGMPSGGASSERHEADAPLTGQGSR